MIKRTIVLCVGLLLLLMNQASFADEATTFKHPERNYSITFPAEWTKKDDAQGLDVMYLAPPNKEDFSNDATVNVKTGALPEQITLDQFFSVNVENLKKAFKDFSIVDQGASKIGGIDAKFIVYTYNQNEMNITIRQYFLIKDHFAYLFTFGAESKYYNDYKPVFDEILSSIKL